MTFQGNPEAVPFLIASAVAAAVSVAAWRRRGHPGGLALLAMMVGETGWALFEAAELVLVDPSAKKLCFALRTSSAIVAVLGLVHFVLRYTGHTSWLRPRRCVWFWAPAVIPLVLVWTNDLHHLYWAGLPSGRFVQSYGTFLLAVPRYGPVFWIHFGYCYLLLAVVAVLLADAMSRSVGAYRVQAGVMLVGVLLPWGMNVVDMTRLFGFIHVDSVAIAFGLTGLAVLPAFYRYGLLDLAPIACAAVVRGMADPVVVLDAGGRVVALNASAEGVLGQTLAELLGQPAAASFRNWPALSARLAGPDGAAFDVEGDGPAGGRSFEGRVSRLEDNGRPVGAVLVLRDVTERRLAEAAHAARVEAEADARARETFLAVLSHELRTPLTPLLAEAEVLLDDPETPPSLRPSLARIRRNAEIEARLIDDLLDLTRGRQGRLHMSPAVVDAHAVIRQAVEVCEGDLRARGLTLELDLSAGAYHLWFDPARLQQVVWNLLKNAVKFSHPGGRVTVRTRGKEPPAEGHPARLVLEVADQGVGIDAALLPRVFDPFEQGDSETARRSGGLGLGLAICREIVEAHGGRISASSPGKGRGASLRVELETVAEPAHPVPALAPVEDDPGRPMLRVLLVEDNYDSREAVSRILSAQGFAIQTAGDVRTAIALADATSFDIVVSDIGLPDGSGLDLMRTLRQREGAPIAGIAISGYGTDEDVRQSLEAGFVSHLTKPLRTRDLSASILKAAETG